MSALPVPADESLPISAAGYEARCRELEELRSGARLRLSESLREARQDGDLSDNPTLADLLEEQAQLERRIALLESQLAVAEIVEPAADGCAGIGSLVRVRDLAKGEAFEYELVGVLEADAGNGRVSIGAPVGRALLGQRPGDNVEVTTPRGPLLLELLSVCPAQPAATRKAA